MQKYAGSDQRVTARADITDRDWTKLESEKVNPYYTLVWDVSGSEMDFKGANGALDISRENRRPGMDSGHDFTKKPAVLVSGNEEFSLVTPQGDWEARDYPDSYITPETELDQSQSITIVPAERILGRDSLGSGDVHSHSVTAPLVELENNGAYAWWVGDESLKARVNLKDEHPLGSAAAQMMAQRSVIDYYQDGHSTVGLEPEKVDAMLSVGSASLAASARSGQSYTYSPDITTYSESLLTDVRNGGVKKDLSFVLFQPDSVQGMPKELDDDVALLDKIDGRSYGEGDGDSDLGGLTPYVKFWREYAQQSNLKENRAVPIGQHGVTPVMTQVQAGVHGAIEVVEGSKFKVYMGIYPAVVIWNPYTVPILIDKKIEVLMERRSWTANWRKNLFGANYKIQKTVGTSITSEAFDGIFSDDEGWNFKLSINPTQGLSIPPGRAMVFSAGETTVDSDVPVGRNEFEITLRPGWRPALGHLFPIDGVEHDANDYRDADEAAFPRMSIGLGGTRAFDNLNFKALYHDQGAIQYLSYWSRLQSSTATESAFFSPPSITDANQDTRGTFPSMLYKYALRTGDDYLITPSAGVHEDQLALNFPYMAHYNPRAVYHAGIGDSYSHDPAAHNYTQFYSSEGTESSPSLMGALYDYQNATTTYTIPTPTAQGTYTFIGAGYFGAESMLLVSPPVSLKSVKNGERAGVVSLTQLNHSNGFIGARKPEGDYHYNWLSTSNMPAEPIGNSLGDFRLNVEHKQLPFDGLKHWGSLAKLDSQSWGMTWTRLFCGLYDVSYLMNDMLYDRYFFSTLPSKGAYDPDSPLVNSRLSVMKGFQDKLDSVDSAQYLRLLGGFNVNSTSVPAWEILLSSSLGVGGQTEAVSFSPYRSYGGSAKVTEMDDVDAATGDIRVIIEQAEVRRLAEAIVREVKRRGPFPSVASFVNRTNRLSDLLRDKANAIESGEHIGDVRYAGALQSAIDAAQLNSEIDRGNGVDSTDFVGDPRFYPGVKAVRKAASSHLAGSVKQSDILRQIDPMITVRGDTFVICTVGVCRDDRGRILAKAACEVVVQRSLDYMDSSQKPDQMPYEISGTSGSRKRIVEQLSETNKRLGRAFKVVDFKWLTSAELAQMKIYGGS